jgi:hypothetical protein
MLTQRASMAMPAVLFVELWVPFYGSIQVLRSDGRKGVGIDHTCSPGFENK